MTENPYQTPAAKVIEADTSNSGMAKIYSPNQIAVGSFWGGPIAAIYFLRSNYLSLGQANFAERILIVGIIFCLLLLGLLPFLPEKFPHTALPLAYCFAAKHLAVSTQLSKVDIETGEDYEFASNWKVFGVGTLCLVVFFTIAIGVWFVLGTLGVLSID